IEEAAEYKKEGKGHIVLIVSAFAASAAAIAVVNNLPGYTSDPHDFEVDYSVQTVVTTEASTAGTSDTDAVSYVSAGTGTAPFTEPSIPETSKSSDTSNPVTNEVTEAAQTESPSKTAAPPSPSPSAENVRTEADPVTEPHVITEAPATEKIVTEATNTQESQTLPPRPVPSPDPPVTVPERPTPLPTPMPGTTVTVPESPTPVGGSVERPVPSPDPPALLPVNRENNSYDHAVLSEKSYSKRCVYIFSEDQTGENTVLPFFIEDVSTGSGCRAIAKTVNEFSSDEIFLLKCGATEGKYYVFLNDSLSAEEEDKIFKTLGITEFN
ncbi:MAG: hypothetical protein J5864_01780, partial [Oscillospiraceae bacterium]|nr:hypothetical protein [Oscillospiraceae bacterium]